MTFEVARLKSVRNTNFQAMHLLRNLKGSDWLSFSAAPRSYFLSTFALFRTLKNPVSMVPFATVFESIFSGFVFNCNNSASCKWEGSEIIHELQSLNLEWTFNYNIT